MNKELLSIIAQEYFSSAYTTEEKEILLDELIEMLKNNRKGIIG